MKKLLWVLIVLTVVLCLPLCVFASEATETAGDYVDALGNYTKTEFNNFWRDKNTRGIDIIEERDKEGLPKDASGKYIVPPEILKFGFRIMAQSICIVCDSFRCLARKHTHRQAQHHRQHNQHPKQLLHVRSPPALKSDSRENAKSGTFHIFYHYI